MKAKVLIVGGGIAGLTTKYLLESLEYDLFLAEKDEALRADGAGLLLGANVLNIFQKIGLQEELLAKSQILDSLITTDEKGNLLDKIDFKTLYEKTALPSVGIHREDLHRILFENSSQENMLYSSEFMHLREDDNQVTFTNGSTQKYNHIIAADGVSSALRKQLFGEEPLRDTKQACWRFVMDSPQNYDRTTAYEMWGDQKRVGIFPIGKDKLYCYLVSSQSGDENKREVDEVLALFDSFEGNWSIVKEHIELKSLKLLFNPLADTQSITLQKDGIVFIGDSGHSTTPNLGQGAAMAIESAYSFYELLKEHDYQDAVVEYEKRRIKKVTTIKERSIVIGKLAHMRSRFLQKVRNTIMKIIPSALTQKEFEKLILH